MGTQEPGRAASSDRGLLVVDARIEQAAAHSGGRLHPDQCSVAARAVAEVRGDPDIIQREIEERALELARERWVSDGYDRPTRAQADNLIQVSANVDAARK